MTVESIKISFLGVSERAKSAFQIFFESMGQAKYELIDDHSKAQLCLVDKDTYDVQPQYDALAKDYPDMHVLILSVLEYSCVRDKEFFLQKPVKRDGLQQSLDQIYCLLSGKSTHDKNVNDKSTGEVSKVLPFQSSETRSEDKIKKLPEKVKNNADDNAHKDSAKPVKKVKENKAVPVKERKKISTTNAGNLLEVEQKKNFIAQQRERHLVGQQCDVDVNDPEQLKNIFYEPNGSLQSIMNMVWIKSQQSKQLVQLDILDYVFYFDPQKQKVYSIAGLATIRSLCVIEYDDQAACSVKNDAFRDELYDCFRPGKDKAMSGVLATQCWKVDYFMWLVALWCSRGRLPQGTGLTQPVYLTQWPNLTRLEPIPYAARITALIYERPCTLVDIAEQLKIEQRYVFAFFSACKALGLSDISRRDVNGLFATKKPETHKNKSILSKLLGKLVNFS